MSVSVWKKCLDSLEKEIGSQQFNTWIRPLQTVEKDSLLRLFAPNRFVMEWVQEQYFDIIQRSLEKDNNRYQVTIEVGCQDASESTKKEIKQSDTKNQSITKNTQNLPNLNKDFIFDAFVSGNSNQLAHAASMQVAEHPGTSYNPLFIYGDVGLGKTHLMHAIGHEIFKQYSNVVYLHSERFVQKMVTALQHNTISQFKHHYRSLDALLIDDIQFLAGKERSQEEFFHTFNTLIEGKRQVVLTCDCYPKEVNGLEERLKSRFGWGLTVFIEPPELETRVAILKSKISRTNKIIPEEVCYLIAKHFNLNVRELEGALNRVVANSNLTNRPIDIDLAKEALGDLLLLKDKLITIENIQKTTAEYYKIRLADILSKKRSRSFSRPRQIAMALSKELTNHSLPEIGANFGGRDHTTVLYACRKISKLKTNDQRIKEDYDSLSRMLVA